MNVFGPPTQMAFVAMPLAMKAINVACSQGTDSLRSFVKRIIHENQATVCGPEFAGILVEKTFALMKESRFFPKSVREALEANRSILDEFATQLTQDPRFRGACDTKNMEALDGVIDAKIDALKAKLVVCKKGGRASRKSRRKSVRRTRRARRT